MPGKSHGWRSLACCDSWGHKELDTTELLNWSEHITVPSICAVISGYSTLFHFSIPVHIPYHLTLLLFNYSVMFNSLRAHRLQHARLSCPSSSPRACSNSCSLSGDALQPSHPLLPSFPPAFSLSQHQVFSNESSLCIRWSKYWSFSFSISVGNEYSGLISLGWTGLISFQSKGFLRLQFKSINSSVLSLLYGPTLTSIYDYWKNHSFEYVDLCWQSDVSAF